jgi:hypothetical protein
MTGKRVYPDRRTGALPLGDGEYGRNSAGVWCGKPPGHRMVCFFDMDVTEHADGTITVARRIESGWHGRLIKGEWKLAP